MPRPAPHRTLRRPALLAALAWAVALLVNRSLRRVEGPSMLPSLWPGDLLVTAPARLVPPRPGDVVVAEVGGRRVTKRLAAGPSARLELRDGHVLADGVWWATPDVVPVDEDVLLRTGADEVALLGDHRARSTDARATGPVGADTVERVALARLRPWGWLRGRTHPRVGPRPRPGVRVVVLDPDDRVLLFRVTDADGGPATWWEAPGGGRRPGEPVLAAARRELAEEIGASDVDPVVLGEVTRRTTVVQGAPLDKVDDVLAVRLTSPRVDTSGWTASEVRDIAEVRWWTPRELATLPPGQVVPPDVVRLAALAAERV